MAQTSGFTIVAPAEIDCTIGQSATGIITVQRTGKGKNRRVTLSATAPQGIRVTLAPQVGFPTYASQIQLTCDSNLVPGDYPVDVRGAQ